MTIALPLRRGEFSAWLVPCSLTLLSPPKFRTLLPGENINFEGFRSGVSSLEDQCARLMGSLEEASRTITSLTAEEDPYKEFWQAMNNYHNVMSRFQVSAATAGPQISFPFNLEGRGIERRHRKDAGEVSLWNPVSSSMCQTRSNMPRMNILPNTQAGRCFSEAVSSLVYTELPKHPHCKITRRRKEAKGVCGHLK